MRGKIAAAGRRAAGAARGSRGMSRRRKAGGAKSMARKLTGRG